ncbi:adenosine deaminase [Suipraeoptans intestinalis]|uniref:adenosine deaminase n=1 Tax=Suipraeoptans intestinalis TaxID=2606628 RepID=UPI0023F0BA55|nr:adenosine deaminase [Suipraeoptans intestinalis]MDD7769961.1 adenosine deaminase [Suipraeoptans intestinalis]
MCTRENRLPKLDLHCHLDGSLSREWFEEVTGRRVETSEIQVGRACRSLAEYLEKFDLPLQYLQTEENLKKAGKEFLLGAKKENIDYIEVRFAPLLSVSKGLTAQKVIEAVLEGLAEGKKECGVYYNVIVCAMRHHSVEDGLRLAEAAREFLGEGVCAMDLAGNEAAYPMHLFREVFLQARKLGLPFTIHAGECGSVENVTEAIELGARRIGHGIALRGQKQAMELCRRNQVGVELCPTSNLQTKAVKEGELYPIQEFLANDLLVSVNTDNRTVSNTSIEEEMAHIAGAYGVTEEEIRKLTQNAIETAFASDFIKQELWKKCR